LLKPKANDIQYHLGKNDDTETDIEDLHFNVISMKLCELNVVPTLVVAHLDKHLHDIEWVIPRLGGGAKESKGGAAGYGEEVAEATIDRLKPVVDTLLTLAVTMLDNKTCTEIFKTVRRTFAALTPVVKYLMARKPDCVHSKEFKALVEGVQNLTEMTYSLITFATSANAESSTASRKSKADKARARAAVTRESRSIPPLIFVGRLCGVRCIAMPRVWGMLRAAAVLLAKIALECDCRLLAAPLRGLPAAHRSLEKAAAALPKLTPKM